MAASDTSSAGKVQADYVCDGTADDVQINAAIAALPASGGSVKLLEGTYNISSTININGVSDVSLSGVGYSTNITAPSSGELRYMLSIGKPVSKSTRCTVSDLTLTGNAGITGLADGITTGSGDNSATDCTIERVYVTGIKCSGVAIFGDRIILRNCLVTNCGVGVYLNEGTGQLVEGNHLVDTSGTDLGELFYCNTNAKSIRVIGNYFEQNRVL